MAALGDSWYLAPVELDCADGYVADLNAHEGDANGRGIDLRVTLHGETVSMAGMSVYLAWRHRRVKNCQGLTAFMATNAAEGRFKVLYPTSMQHAGDVTARVMIYLASNGTHITGSKNFTISVAGDPIDDDAALADNDFSVFQQAVADLHTATSKAATATSNAEKATAKANDAAKAAGDQAASAKEAAEVASEAAGDASGAAGEARKATTAANTAAKGAEESAKKADSATASATAATGSANAASGRADAAASSANTAASTARNLVSAAVQQLASSGGAGQEAESIEVIAKMLRNDYGCFWLAGTVWTKAAETTWAASTLTLSCATYSNGTMTLG